ncbi:SAG family member [Eimeria brunetti]|uniref:SAG family member n=1 Tax=Eimeria brunetti TaxID=51314 RepID=U6L697_9EIME|nr:SAG family member [Eimeria brunetti]
MAPLKFLSLSCASALLVAQANTQGAKGLSTRSGSEQTVTYSVSLGSPAACLTEINEAREAAGLPNLVEASAAEQKLPENNEAEAKPWDKVCKSLIAEEDGSPVEKAAGTVDTFQSGTYAFMAMSSKEADCAAAVDHWKAAFRNFTSIPPAKTGETTIYDKQQNISFVAMYNPIKDAAADCRVVTCTRKTSAPGHNSNLRSDGQQKEGYALLCMTTPETLKDDGDAPFTEDQWNKIKTSLTDSASAVAPSLVAFAAVALGLAAL